MGLLIDSTMPGILVVRVALKGHCDQAFFAKKLTKLMCGILSITFSKSVFHKFMSHICFLAALHASHANFALSTCDAHPLLPSLVHHNKSIESHLS